MANEIECSHETPAKTAYRGYDTAQTRDHEEMTSIPCIAKKYEITQAQLSRWKKEFLANAAAAFGGSEQQQEMKKLEAERDSCHRKIGELEMELVFAKRVSKALGIPIPAKD